MILVTISYIGDFFAFINLVLFVLLFLTQRDNVWSKEVGKINPNSKVVKKTRLSKLKNFIQPYQNIIDFIQGCIGISMLFYLNKINSMMDYFNIFSAIIGFFLIFYLILRKIVNRNIDKKNINKMSMTAYDTFDFIQGLQTIFARWKLFASLFISISNLFSGFFIIQNNNFQHEKELSKKYVENKGFSNKKKGFVFVCSHHDNIIVSSQNKQYQMNDLNCPIDYCFPNTEQCLTDISLRHTINQSLDSYPSSAHVQ